MTLSPTPWRFALTLYGVRHAIVDARGALIASHVPVGCGVLLSAGPELLSALEHVLRVAPEGPVRAIAEHAVSQYRERTAKLFA